MNRPAAADGFSFCMASMGKGRATLAVTRDPWGEGVTFAGYALLLLSLLLFFLQPRSAWRGWLRRAARPAAVILLLLGAVSGASAQEAPPAPQRPLARRFGDIFVYWNDRVCPMQTMAKDVSAALYGSDTYRGLTSEQVLTGWLFHFDAWRRDFEANHAPSGLDGKKLKRLEERRALIRWLGAGEAFRIYPYRSASGRMEWLSLSGRRPSGMSDGQWRFMSRAMDDIAADMSRGRNVSAARRVALLIEGQRRYAGAGSLPSPARLRAEKTYSALVGGVPPAAALLLLAGTAGLLLSPRRRRRAVAAAWKCLAAAALLYVAGLAVLRGFVGGHVPMSNGFETMACMAALALGGSLAVPRRVPTLGPGLLLVAGAALAVAAMGEARPRIGALPPVLASPLLSVHVMLVMASYALFALMAVIGVRTLLIKDPARRAREAALNHAVLLPAVFLLAAGIFVGAVWASRSWGRYWGWDPKETCALVTMLVYALPLHSRSIPLFRRPRPFSIYVAAAFACVLFTYFGVNCLLPGLHSYA